MLNGFDKKQLTISLVIIMIALATGGALYWQLASYKTQKSSASASPQVDDLSETASIIRQVQQLVDIPADETPTIATVTEEKVREQPFFQSAEIGDKVVVFPQAKKVVLYRPSSGKVINLTALGEESSHSAQAASEQLITITIRNGTTKAGLAGKYESQIKQVYPKAATTKENATKQDYKTSVIVALNPQFQTVVDSLAAKLGIPAGKLPEAEKPEAGDIVVLLGEDKSN